MKLILGTAVLVGRRAVLLRGPTGSGKSSMALALVGRGGPETPVRLLADDALHAKPCGPAVVLTPPQATRGLIEIRGVGLRLVPHVERAVLGLVVDLEEGGPVSARLPEAEECVASICGTEVPRIALDPAGPAAPDIVLAVARAVENGQPPPFMDRALPDERSVT